jgi:hypothetical protein
MKRKLKVLIACEESQRVCTAFRELGHEAYSCDIQEPSGGHPEWHILGDVLEVLNPDTENGCILFDTMNGQSHMVHKWDLIVAHPPCTHLAVSGMRWFKEGVKPRYLQDEAADFFMRFVNADCEHIAVENPICIMSTRYRKPDQIINPFQFGHKQQKKTCLWLKNLPKLIETNNVYTEMMKLPEKERTAIWQMGSGHAKERSKTFPGIAKAMAEQWGDYIEKEAE